MPAPSAFSEIVARTTGCETRLVQVITQGLQTSMRRLQKLDATLLLTELALELEYCAKVFAGGVKTDELVFDELVEFTCTRFGHLSVREVREAFRLAAAGDLGPIDLRAYYGTYTVAMLGELLRGYNTFRQRILVEVRRAEQESLHRAAEEKQRTSWDRAGWELNRVAQLRDMPEPNLQTVTVLDYDVLERRRLLVLTAEQKWQLFEKAGARLQAELRSQIDQAPFGEKVTLRALLERVQNGQTDPTFYVQQVNCAKRMAVLHWIEFERQKPKPN
jgi:hypothetical protein